MPQVLNKKKGKLPLGAVYVGRPSKWGNPFKISKTLTRDDVIQKYEDRIVANIQNNPIVYDLSELKGKDLVCWCHPQPCHAYILLKLANKEE